MNWLWKALSSSVGKKVLMAITGLGLCGFLVAHLAGNLLLYAGPEAYNHYAESLHAQQVLLVVAEIGLLLLFVVHIGLSLKLTQENQSARPVGYEMKQSKLPEAPLVKPAHDIMFGTGIVILLFLILHLADFKFGVRGIAPDGETPFEKALRVLKDPLTFAVYIIGSLVLGYHVLHGFQSAFQSLGLNHPKYTPTIKKLSVVFALVVALGFGSFPLYVAARRDTKAVEIERHAAPATHSHATTTSSTTTTTTKTVNH